jgi:phasin protein
MTTSKGGQSGGGKKGQRSRKTERRGPNAEQVKAEPVKAGPVKTEQVKAEPVKAEPVKAEPVKAEQLQSAKPDSRDEHQAGPTIAQAEVQAEAAVSEVAKPVEVLLSGEVIPPDAPVGGDRPAGVFPPTIEAIAKAYGDYARQSFQTNRSFVERLIGARSFEEAIGVQAEFAKQAYENFVAESLKLCELYGELTRQIFRPFGGLAATITHVRPQVH